MTAISDKLSDSSRALVDRWYRDFQETDRIMREIPAQRPPEAAPTLAQLSAATAERKSA
jgi:hypothetical protein